MHFEIIENNKSKSDKIQFQLKSAIGTPPLCRTHTNSYTYKQTETLIHTFSCSLFTFTFTFTLTNTYACLHTNKANTMKG